MCYNERKQPMKRTHVIPGMLSATEVSTVFGMSRRTLVNWTKSGRIKQTILLGVAYIDLESLKATLGEAAYDALYKKYSEQKK